MTRVDCIAVTLSAGKAITAGNTIELIVKGLLRLGLRRHGSVQGFTLVQVQMINLPVGLFVQ